MEEAYVWEVAYIDWDTHSTICLATSEKEADAARNKYIKQWKMPKKEHNRVEITRYPLNTIVCRMPGD